MTSNGLIGRAYEQKLINSYINSEKAELIAVYGRRRVGKTFLIKRMFDENFAFSFTGIYDVSRAVLLSQFKKHLERYSESTIPKIKNWFEAFDALPSYHGWTRQKAISLQHLGSSGTRGHQHAPTLK